MYLIHYSKDPIDKVLHIEEKKDGQGFMKPVGLWVSDEACTDNWRSWCIGNDFRLDHLAYPYKVDLFKDNNVLVLETSEALETFTKEFGNPIHQGSSMIGIDWKKVERKYGGLIITPYQWDMRFELLWYYGWDCASGVIWDPKQIESFELDRAVARWRA